MKSLVEEASTIGRAIEKCWERAQKPSNFSVRIFEYPEYNFFGLAKKYAKVGIFFEDELPSKNDSYNNKKKDMVETKKMHQKNSTKNTTGQIKKTTVEIVDSKLKKQELPLDAQKEANDLNLKEGFVQAIWTDEMILYTTQCIRKSLDLMGLSTTTFTLSPQNQKLHISLNGDLGNITTRIKEGIFYKSFGHLIVAALRTKFKSSFKHLKLILTRDL